MEAKVSSHTDEAADEHNKLSLKAAKTDRYEETDDKHADGAEDEQMPDDASLRADLRKVDKADTWVGVLVEVIANVAAAENEAMAVNSVKARMLEMIRFFTLDTDGNGRISRDEFEAILISP